jgi:RHS repeat-associated protein
MANSLSTADDATEHHFTGKERDTESGNDYFEARYYASSMGRFLSPDWSAKAEPVPYAKLDNPQSLNLYAYMMNNPLGGVDPDGHGGLSDILADQRVMQFAHDVGVGALKGFGRIVFSALSMTDSRITNPAYAHMQDMPAALNYSNTTQAVAGTVAPIVLPAFGGAVTVAAEVPTIATESVALSGEIPEVASEAFIVRGGTSPMPSPGTTFSGAQGATLEEAAAGVPHGTIRSTTAGAIREGGGTVEAAPELTRSGTMNPNHVNVTEGSGQSSFSEPRSNPVPKKDRIQ